MLDYVLLVDIRPSGIHIAWQLVQIGGMALAETIIYIGGTTFAFMQAPANLKSITQAFWFLTISLGNMFMGVVAVASLVDDQLFEYLLFNVLLIISTLVFSLLGHRLKFNTKAN